MRRKLLFPLLFLAIPLAAQRVENVKAEVFGEGEKVVITYDITGAGQGQKFRVTVYGSHNNYASPLTLVSGDVGRDHEVPAGSNKRIEWSAKSELKDYAGDVTFEVRAELAAAPYNIQYPTLGSSMKRGKTTELRWQGGSPGENVRLDLMKGGVVVSQIISTQNSQRYSWAIPKSLAKANDYQIRLSGESGSVTSLNFKVKPKVGGFVKALPFIIGAGVAAYFIFGGTPTDPELPEPPKYNGQ